jgi:UTP--glucose-1-phosphate uridylyltransferase
MDALNGLAAAGKLVATVVTAAHYDTGSPEGYLKTMVEVGLAHPETGEAFAEWLRERTGLNPQRP